MELKDGIVKLSGFCDATFYVGWDNDEPVDGYIVQINGKNYGAYVDPDDGYRSYGSFFETDKPCTNTFPPQDVLLELIEEKGGYTEPKRKMLLLTNPITKELILRVGTSWYDGYYPMGRCYFNPAAMPINQEKGFTIEIIAEWDRKCGDHVVIGKTENGEYIEGITCKEGLAFGPIVDFKLIN